MQPMAAAVSLLVAARALSHPRPASLHADQDRSRDRRDQGHLRVPAALLAL